MKKLIAFIAVLVSCAFLAMEVQAQSVNYTKRWHMGSLVGVDFSGGAPVSVTGGQAVSIEGSSSACDASGNLLFYTDGATVWNRNHGIMPNGTGLMGGGSASQAALVVPDPGNANQYYIFTTHHSASTGLRWTKVDMTLSGGLGAVIAASKNILLFQPSTERQSAVLHANGTDIWVCGQQSGSNTLRTFRVTPTGIATGPVSSLGGSSVGNIGCMKFSPNGARMAWVDHGSGAAHLYDFDNSTGQFSNYVALATGMSKAYGCSFSPDNSKFYATMGPNYKDIYQWDCCAGSQAAIASSMTFIASYSGGWGGCLQNGPDGKIYFAHYSSQYLGVINAPNNLGAACNYVDNGFSIAPTTVNLAAPSFVESVFLQAPGGSPNGCTVLASDVTEFYAKASDDRKVMVYWNAIEDAHAKHYEVERSLDGSDFKTIGIVGVKEGIGEFHRYSLPDHGPGEGKNYYRLKMVDFNGRHAYSQTVEVEFTGELAGWTAFPVPAHSSLTLSRPLPRNGGTGVLTLVNDLGQTVWRHATNSMETRIQINAFDLSAGMYQLLYTEGDVRSAQPIIIR